MCRFVFESQRSEHMNRSTQNTIGGWRLSRTSAWLPLFLTAITTANSAKSQLVSPLLPTLAPVGAVSRYTDKLDIFTTDAAGVIRTAAWEPDFTDGWHGWWPIQGGQAQAGAP